MRAMRYLTLEFPRKMQDRDLIKKMASLGAIFFNIEW
jgi:hypothetical protein